MTSLEEYCTPIITDCHSSVQCVAPPPPYFQMLFVRRSIPSTGVTDVCVFLKYINWRSNNEECGSIILLLFQYPRLFCGSRAFDSCTIYHHEATDLRKNENENETDPFLNMTLDPQPWNAILLVLKHSPVVLHENHVHITQDHQQTGASGIHTTAFAHMRSSNTPPEYARL